MVAGRAADCESGPCRSSHGSENLALIRSSWTMQTTTPLRLAEVLTARRKADGSEPSRCAPIVGR
jgi:hypothetical protein